MERAFLAALAVTISSQTQHGTTSAFNFLLRETI
jgi:hypothetical protein